VELGKALWVVGREGNQEARVVVRRDEGAMVGVKWGGEVRVVVGG
jgi:hypothetical protein